MKFAQTAPRLVIKPTGRTRELGAIFLYTTHDQKFVWSVRYGNGEYYLYHRTFTTPRGIWRLVSHWDGDLNVAQAMRQIAAIVVGTELGHDVLLCEIDPMTYVVSATPKF